MIHIIPYSSDFEEGIKALCRIPVSEQIHISLEREPSYLTGAHVQCEVPLIYVALSDESQVVGVCNIGTRRLWYRQQIISVPYLCDLRIDKRYKGLQILARFSKLYLEMHRDGAYPGQTIVFSDNKLMLSLIDKRKQKPHLLYFPYYHSASIYISTFLRKITKKHTLPEDFSIINASKSNLNDLQQFIDNESSKIDYFPYYNLKELNQPYYTGLKLDDYLILYKSGNIVGVCGVWDQSKIKQTRVVGYTPIIKKFRRLYNLFASIRGKMKLPILGEKINYLSLHTILVQNRSPQLFSYLLHYIQEYKLEEEDQYLLIGLDKQDPLYNSLKEFNIARQMTGQYFYVTHNEKTELSVQNKFYYFETARI